MQFIYIYLKRSHKHDWGEKGNGAILNMRFKETTQQTKPNPLELAKYKVQCLCYFHLRCLPSPLFSAPPVALLESVDLVKGPCLN